MRNLTRAIVAAVCGLLLVPVFGCAAASELRAVGATVRQAVGAVTALKGPAEAFSELPRQLALAMEDARKLIGDQGVIDKFMAGAEGEFIEPGLEVGGVIKIAAYAKLTGFSGRVAFETEGTGTQLPPDVRAKLIEQLDGPLSDEQRNAILEILGWNRVESPHNPVPDP